MSQPCVCACMCSAILAVRRMFELLTECVFVVESSNDDMSRKQRRQSIQLADTEVPQTFINFQELKSQISNTGQESFSIDI